MTYLVVLEQGPKNWGAWVPDLPVCFSTGETLPAVRANIREAIDAHLELLRADSDSIPPPASIYEVIGKYLVVFQPELGLWRGFVPDLPDCEASGPNLDAARELTHSSLTARIAELERRGVPVPVPLSIGEYVEVLEPVSGSRR